MNAEQLRAYLDEGMDAVKSSNKKVQNSNMLTAADAGKEALQVMTQQMEYMTAAVCLFLRGAGKENV